eukprot:scaffold10794_cov66-Phaeocystis_antarctica.AAC.13
MSSTSSPRPPRSPPRPGLARCFAAAPCRMAAIRCAASSDLDSIGWSASSSPVAHTFDAFAKSQRSSSSVHATSSARFRIKSAPSASGDWARARAVT